LKTDSRKFNLAVNFIPDVITAPVSLTVIQPNSAVFNCTGNGLPRPSIKWVYNNNTTALQSSNGYMITSTTDSLTQITSHLTINSSEAVELEPDNAEYKSSLQQLEGGPPNPPPAAGGPNVPPPGMPFGFPPMPPDIGNLFSNPAFANMANTVMSNPAFQNM
jgi:hypothetical protein